MGGWSNDNRDTVTWDGNIKAKQFLGDGSLLTGGITGSGQSPRIAFWDGTNILGSDSVFTWNKISNILNVTGGDGAGSGSTFVFSDGLRSVKMDSTNGYTSNTPFTISGTNTFQNNAELEVNSLSGRNLVTFFGNTYNFVVSGNGGMGAEIAMNNYPMVDVSYIDWHTNTSPPATTGSPPFFTDTFGGTGVALGEPSNWVDITIGATPYKIPVYLA